MLTQAEFNAAVTKILKWLLVPHPSITAGGRKHALALLKTITDMRITDAEPVPAPSTPTVCDEFAIEEWLRRKYTCKAGRFGIEYMTAGVDDLAREIVNHIEQLQSGTNTGSGPLVMFYRDRKDRREQRAKDWRQGKCTLCLAVLSSVKEGDAVPVCYEPLCIHARKQSPVWKS